MNKFRNTFIAVGLFLSISNISFPVSGQFEQSRVLIHQVSRGRTQRTTGQAQVQPRRVPARAAVIPFRTIRTSGFVVSLAFSPDGASLAIGSIFSLGPENTFYQVKLFDTVSGKLIREFNGDEGGGSSLFSMCFSLDSRVLSLSTMYLNGEWLVDIFDVRTGTLLRKWNDECLVSALAISPNNQVIAGIACNDVKFWDLQTGRTLRTVPAGSGGSITSFDFSPDGQTLALALNDDSIILWDVRTGRSRLLGRGSSGKLTSLVFSPDGTKLTTGSLHLNGNKTSSGELRTWEISTGRSVLISSENGIDGVSFMRNGELLVSREQLTEATTKKAAVYDLRVWETRSGTQLVRLNNVGKFAVSRDGRYAATIGSKSVIRIWDMTKLTAT